MTCKGFGPFDLVRFCLGGGGRGTVFAWGDCFKGAMSDLCVEGFFPGFNAFLFKWEGFCFVLRECVFIFCLLFCFNIMHTRGIVKTMGLQGFL